ncbi:MAG TPA: acyl-CoA dehydrogenase [Myxococcales bacterium]|nr:acyl-CoA dehydrogenase [Myxococcales bacterium]HIL02329.1 acyl-CoA dehydrogenase [Myxococcales bacterium]
MAGLETVDAMFDLRMSEGAKPLFEKVKTFIKDEVQPITAEFFRLGEGREERWSWAPGQLELLDGVKAKAKAQGLWNFFLPDDATGQGLSNLDYAYIATELGKNPLASECLNCAAPDTGNMEVLERVGTDEQKKKWLEPLLNGEIRSAYAMTEPDIASSDAKNIACQARLDGDEWVIDGEKFYISGAGDPRCKIMIVMVQTDPDGPPHTRQSQILVPTDAPGFEILGPMCVFGKDDAPHGHMHIRFNNCRVPKENILLGEGRGFEISQVRLGPGRIHHCMRSIGAAERAIELMSKRGISRKAFGKPIAQLGKNIETIAKARIDIESMRMMVLKAAKAMDVLGNAQARVWVSAVKAMVPVRVCQIIDDAIQIHGATGVSHWTPLADMYAGQRTLRLADGPDEVHWFVVGRAELAKWSDDGAMDYNPKEAFMSSPIFSGP